MERPITRVITHTGASISRPLWQRSAWTCPSCLVSNHKGAAVGAAKARHHGADAFARSGQRRFLADVIDAPVPPASFVVQRSTQQGRTSRHEVESKTLQQASPARDADHAGTVGVGQRVMGPVAGNDGGKKWSTPLAKIIADAIEVRDAL